MEEKRRAAREVIDILEKISQLLVRAPFQNAVLQYLLKAEYWTGP